ncbi:hypothetical protein ASD37_02100 [Mycobacterium sp. Root135]|uniref:hypothetical protein n=1 Tax=Mycobacterium sp. Root135 TaxID=1736457 RepID=UPI0006F3C2E9|nr:hypothetical protein [Mycobacterium sp. Root135]KQY09276.1 hypothetical protein ASD37_02100 [Mycobacterium sp. Root135]
MSDFDVITAADTARQSALDAAITAIQTLQQASGEVPDANDPTVQALIRQLFTPLDSNFWSTVEQALIAIESNKSFTGSAPLVPDRSVTDDFAHVDPSLDPNLGIIFGEPFFEDADETCQREVITHEYFHFVVGAQHHYGTTSTLEALACPHHLTELVFDIALGEVNGCDDGSACF